MKRLVSIKSALLAMLVIFSIAAAAFAGNEAKESKEKQEPGEKYVKMNDLKDPVKSVVEKQLAGKEASEIEVKTKDGKEIYEIKTMENGKENTFMVREDGKYLGVGEVDDEESEDENEKKEAKEDEESGDDVFTEYFAEKKSDLVSSGTNPYFILEPGYVFTFEGKEDGEKGNLIITVLNETEIVDGVETRIVEEKESVNDKIVEISRNYFAISKRTNNVYYFGEESKTYKDGKVINLSGSWRAGENGAKYGLFMEGTPLVGARYYQEVAPKAAMDRAENISISETIEVPAGKFEKCLKIKETSPLEPKTKEFKYYAEGAGLLMDGDLKLTKISSGKEKPADKK